MKNKKKFLQIILLIIFIFSIYKVGVRIKSNHDFDQSQREVQLIRKSQGSAQINDPTAAEKEAFKELKSAMPSLVAWLNIPRTDIDFPVVQGPDNEFYLNHDYAGNYNPLGAVFLEIENTPDFSDQNSIIYGHNVRSGKVFHSLTNYLDPNFLDQAPIIELLTSEGKKTYKIQSIYEADPYYNFRSPHYEDDAW